jgi:hypothetical protein
MNRAIIGVGIIAALMAAPCAFAQSVLGGATRVPLAPPVAAVPARPAPLPQVQTPDTPPPPGLVQTPLPSYGAGADESGASSGPSAARLPPTAGSSPRTAAAAAARPTSMPALPNTWLPQREAVLGVLNKEDGSVSRLSVPVGDEVTQGKLRIKVLACIIRPPAVPPDSAVFLSVRRLGEGQDQHAQDAAAQKDNPVFRGWLLYSEPGAAVVDDATDTFRVIGCA